ncbi:MAG: nucleotide sugar dehydrogenase [Robiginitomaculum sp.]|nr:nucleotide sugar dehydrogenase [Robiginitomaculum sp.]
MSITKEFLQKANDGTLVVGIVGLGYVGLPLADAYVAKNVKVIGYDISQARVDELNSGKSGMRHIADSRVASMVEKGLFRATTNAADLKEADALLIAVPTPLDKYHRPDLSYVKDTCETLKDHLRRGQLVVLESTTYPGTTEEVMQPILEKSGLVAGEDFAMAYSPEREDPGNEDFETATIPKVVGADTEGARAMANAVYEKIVETVIVSNARTAEATKLVENIYRWINIAAVNEMKIIFEKMDIDIWEVIDAAKTKPFGFHAFYPGPGVGGHCIRIDPYYLSWKAREHGLATHFIELAGEINTKMPRRIISRLLEEMSLRHQKALSGSKVLLCGLAYKKNIDDMRESPSLELFHILKEHGANVEYYDSYIPEIPMTREHPEFTGLKSIEWSQAKLSEFDAVVIATDHTNVAYEDLGKYVPLIIDTRNVMAEFSEKYADKIVKA